jgi:acyl-CoA thioesterase
VRVAGTCAREQHPAIDLTLILTSDRESPRLVESTAPEVPSPDGLTSAEGGPLSGAPGILNAPRLFDHLDVRTAGGRLPWDDGWVAGQGGRHLRWARFTTAPKLDDGTYDPLALLVLADLPGPAIWQQFGPDEPMLFFMSLDLSLTVLEPVRDEWILTDIRSRRLDAGHAYVETDLWSADRLVATSAQTMLVRRPFTA